MRNHLPPLLALLLAGCAPALGPAPVPKSVGALATAQSLSGQASAWPAAAWGPVFLQGTAGNTSGLWRATTIPQWEAGETVSSNWAGRPTP